MPTESFSLEGEDLIAWSLLRNAKSITYFDIGCADPIVINNTYFFYTRGSAGLAVDARAELAAVWAKTRERDKFLPALLDSEDQNLREFWSFPDPTLNTCDRNTASRYSMRFNPDDVHCKKFYTRSASALWREYMGDTPPTLVSIDVEGNELPIIRGLIREDFRPALCIVEMKLFRFNESTAHPTLQLMTELNYKLIAKTPLDGFFIDPLNPLFAWLPGEMR